MTHPDNDMLNVCIPRTAYDVFATTAAERANVAWRTAGNPAANRSQRTKAREEGKFWDSVVEQMEEHTQAPLSDTQEKGGET